MPITILGPKSMPARPAAAIPSNVGSESDSDASGGGADLDSDMAMRPVKRRRRGPGGDDKYDIVTPGEVITDDPQWMRGHGTYLSATTAAITSSVAGTLARTNRLLAVSPLRARYAPEVGDLVVGRVAEVQARRWRVDVGAAQLALLPLSAINLPGGVLRRRTETDELQMRAFFAEGDVLVAEVQQLYGDGAAVLHARSLRYGKLRNGVFVAVAGGGAGLGAGAGGGGGGVVRARRQVWSFEAANGGGMVEVVLGVNGYVWICKHVDAAAAAAEAAAGAAGEGAVSGAAGAGRATAGSAGITSLEEGVGAAVYSSQNDPIDVETMREITRIRGVITALVANGLRVDEDMVTKGYHEAVEMALHDPSQVYLGGEKGQQLAAALTGR